MKKKHINLNFTLCFPGFHSVTLAGEKAFVPQQPRIGQDPALQLKPKSVPEIGVLRDQCKSFPALLLSSPSKGSLVPVLTEALPGDQVHTGSQDPPLAQPKANCRKPVIRWTFIQHPGSMTSGSLRTNTNRAGHIFPGDVVSRMGSNLACCPHIHAGEPSPGVGFQIFLKVITSLFPQWTQSEGDLKNQKTGKYLLDTLPVSHPCWAKYQKKIYCELKNA